MKSQILLVDDHQMARRALKLFLEQQGYTCEEADDGASALEKLEAGGTPDLIISDNQMPIMSGMEFLVNIKTHSRFSSQSADDLSRASIFFVRRTSTDWTHTGFAISFDQDSFETIEGNTNDEGSREGYEVCSRFRGFPKKDFIIL